MHKEARREQTALSSRCKGKPNKSNPLRKTPGRDELPSKSTVKLPSADA